MGKNTPLDVDSRIDADWESVPHPVLVVDRDGLVRTLSASARTMLAEIAPGSALNDFVPSWLADQATRVAHQTPLPGGEVAWWLIDDPDHSARETRQALAMERERAAFLDEASAVLMASLNIDRCMEATVQMAARHIADAAVLVLSLIHI